MMPVTRKRAPRVVNLHDQAYVTVQQYADLLHLSERTVYRYVEKGSIEVAKVGGAVRIPTKQFDPSDD